MLLLSSDLSFLSLPVVLIDAMFVVMMLYPGIELQANSKFPQLVLSFRQTTPLYFSIFVTSTSPL